MIGKSLKIKIRIARSNPELQKSNNAGRKIRMILMRWMNDVIRKKLTWEGRHMKKKPMKKAQQKIDRISGEFREIRYDPKIKILNVQLATNHIGSPILIFEDWSKEKESRHLFRLHIKEAVELKSIIDNAIISWHTYQNEGQCKHDNNNSI